MSDHAKDRPALPPGDCVTWSALVENTLLDGRPWPGFGPFGWDCPLAQDEPR